MKKNKLIDFLIIVLVYLALSCIPFGLFIKDNWLILTLQIVMQIGILVFIILFGFLKSCLDHKQEKINLTNTALMIPTLVVCLSNFIILRYVTGQSPVNANLELFLNIGLTLFVVVNEEFIFRLLLINNLEIKNDVLVILISAGIFGVCHLTHFLSTFNPADLLVVVYTFLLGLLLGFAYLFTKSIYPCIVIHLLFNLLNNILFPYFILEWWYFLFTALIAVAVSIYVLLLYLLKMRKSKPEKEME